MKAITSVAFFLAGTSFLTGELFAQTVEYDPNKDFNPDFPDGDQQVTPTKPDVIDNNRDENSNFRDGDLAG